MHGKREVSNGQLWFRKVGSRCNLDGHCKCGGSVQAEEKRNTVVLRGSHRREESHFHSTAQHAGLRLSVHELSLEPSPGLRDKSGSKATDSQGFHTRLNVMVHDVQWIVKTQTTRSGVR